MSTKVITLVFLVIAVAALGTAFYYYRAYTNVLSDPSVLQKNESQEITKALSRHIVVPEEEPNIGTITDTSILASQPFFAKAALGDKIIIYKNAGKAIIYRPSIDRIIEFGPINVGATSSSTLP